MRHDLLLLIAAMRAYRRVFAVAECDCGATWDRADGDDCRWCATRRDAQARAVLRPPARRCYGYATPAMLAADGTDVAAEREADLNAWRVDLRMAVAAGIVTDDQADTAWALTKRERDRLRGA